MSAQPSPKRHKLGLALAGGGFRASLFHLGVLHRLAELDLLRYVEVLSTVSGGSIIGALYALLLKQRLDRPESRGRLSRDGYVALVDELHRILVRGVQRNLRTRLFLNPVGILRVLLTPRSLGQRMARLYERYVYRDAAHKLRRDGVWRRIMRPGWIPLADLHVKPGGATIEGGIEMYNRRIVDDAVRRPAGSRDAPGSVVTKLVLNATSLNSGARFWFSAVELGDWFLGHFRADEFDELHRRKALLEPPITLGQLEAALATAGDEVTVGGARYPRRCVALALWWRRRRQRARRGEAAAETVAPEGWEALFAVPAFPGRLATAPFGRLRLAKLHAWYVGPGAELQISGGLPPEGHWKRLWDEVERMDEPLAGDLRLAVEEDPALAEVLVAFVIELYYLRSAEVVASRFRQHWSRLSVGDAVGASACFPPVFPPYQELGFYDDAYVSRLGLTDGGVFDNVGLTALLDEECSHIIASDTGGLFDTVEQVSTGRLGMMGRIANILMADVGWKQRDLAYDRRRVSERITRHLAAHPADDSWRRFQEGWAVYGLAFFHISSPPIRLPADAAATEPAPLEPPIAGSRLARIRTDLDAFGDVEVAALVNHGYLMADRYLRREFHTSPYRDDRYWDTPPMLPLPLDVDEGVERIVRVGQARFGRALRLGAPLSWAVTGVAALALAGVIWLLRDNPVSLAGAFRWIAARAAGALEWTIPVPVSGWTERAWPLGAAVLVVTGAVVAWVIVRRVFRLRVAESLTQRGFVRAARRVAAVAQWARGVSGNLLWVVGGAPLWIALGSAVAAAVSYVFFHLPFMRATRRA